MVGTVENWKAEILTVCLKACGIPLAVHRIDDSGIWKVFFLKKKCALYASGVRTEFDDSVGCCVFLTSCCVSF